MHCAIVVRYVYVPLVCGIVKENKGNRGLGGGGGPPLALDERRTPFFCSAMRGLRMRAIKIIWTGGKKRKRRRKGAEP